MKRMLIVIYTAIVLIASSLPQAMAADTSPPELVDWGLTVNKADITTTDAVVTVRFILSDDSGITLPNLLLKSLSTTQMTSFATVRELSRSGKLVSYEASAVIKLGQSPKVWEWVLYPLRDVLGNASTVFGPGGTWRTQISVIDATFTDDILKCEGLVDIWNKQVQKFQLFESKYSGAQEIAVVRLKFRMPIEVLQVANCSNQEFRFKYALDSSSPVYLMVNNTNLANVFADLENVVRVRVQDELDAKAAVELKAKQAADAKAAAELKAKQAAEAKVAAVKKSTIKCVNGKLTKKVTGVKPKCPSGYKVKK
jgi:hypothetical protein